MVRAGLLAALLLTGCTDDLPTVDGSMPPADGGQDDLGVRDGGGALAGAFTIAGCATLDQTTDVPRCTGAAPLELTFVPLVAGVDTFVWTFTGGDPPASKAITPSVLFAKPGSYSVGLAAGGSGGTITASASVVVVAGGAGAACVDASDCDVAGGLTCVCGGGSCPGGLVVGLCTRLCGGGAVCAPGEVCADLARGGTGVMPTADGGADEDGGVPNNGDAWRQPLCLRACAASTDCRTGLTCREVPALAAGASSGGSYGWKKGCFADPLGDDGDACDGADGLPAPALCLSGRCDPLGARGLCTSDCTTVACPTLAACATFNGQPAAPVCLRRCEAAATTCPSAANDPLLDCEPAGKLGALGFTISPGEPPATLYCAPRRCTVPADCAPAGVCTTLAGGSFCTKS